MSHIYAETDALPVPTYLTGKGLWVNFTVSDDGDARKAAATGVSIEALADRTTYLRHRAETATPYGSTFDTITNSGATVGASNNFVLKKAVPISSSVPAGGAGYTAPTIWVTPTTPYVIEGCYISLTSSVACSAAPSYVQFDVYLGADKLITGTLGSFGGGSVAPINGTTFNKSIFGVAIADRGALLDGTFTNSGKDLVGAATADGKLVAYTNVLGSAFFGAPITLRVTHGAVSAITIATAMSVVIYGRLL